MRRGRFAVPVAEPGKGRLCRHCRIHDGGHRQPKGGADDGRAASRLLTGRGLDSSVSHGLDPGVCCGRHECRLCGRDGRWVCRGRASTGRGAAIQRWFCRALSPPTLQNLRAAHPASPNRRAGGAARRCAAVQQAAPRFRAGVRVGRSHCGHGRPMTYTRRGNRPQAPRHRRAAPTARRLGDVRCIAQSCLGFGLDKVLPNYRRIAAPRPIDGA